MKNKNLEQDIAFMATINKAIELNNISMNASKEMRYQSIGTLLFNIKQTLEDGLREEYVDVPLAEVDAQKYTSVPIKNNKSVGNDNDDDEDDEIIVEKMNGNLVIVGNLYENLYDKIDHSKLSKCIHLDTIIGSESEFIFSDELLNKPLGCLYEDGYCEIHIMYLEELLQSLNCKNKDELYQLYLTEMDCNLDLADIQQDETYSCLCTVPNFNGTVRCYETQNEALMVEFQGKNTQTGKDYKLSLTNDDEYCN